MMRCMVPVIAIALMGAGCGEGSDSERYTMSLAGTSTDASSGAICGDGVIGTGEECDDGNTQNNDGCSADCRYEYCGDGIVQQALGEECDDGGYRNDDGCDMFCQIERYGTDADVDAPPPVDAGVDASPPPPVDAAVDAPPPPPVDAAVDAHVDAQATVDAPPGVCGNGMVEGGEECDDGNTQSNDGCSDDCKYEYCGDGIVQSALGEQCDDGNYRNDDGCDMFCQIERY